MKNKLNRALLCCLAAFALGRVEAHATLNGYNMDPGFAAWDRGDANTGYAAFDLFTAWQFNQVAAGMSSGITAPVWSQNNPFIGGAQGGGLYLQQTGIPAPGNNAPTMTDPTKPGDNPGTNGDVLFGGGNPLNFVFNGEVSFEIRGFVLQVKRAGSTGTMTDANGFGLTPTLSINGGTPIRADNAGLSSVINDNSDPSSDTGNSAITSYYWHQSLAGLIEGGTNTYEVFIKRGDEGVMNGMNRGIDGFEIDVSHIAVVPEPTSAALLLGGLGLVGLHRRRGHRHAGVPQS